MEIVFGAAENDSECHNIAPSFLSFQKKIGKKLQATVTSSSYEKAHNMRLALSIFALKYLWHEFFFFVFSGW